MQDTEQHLDTVAGGPSTTYVWHPSAQDQRLREIWNKDSSGATLPKFNYEYNAAGQIQSWRREGLAAGEATAYSFNYDPAGQLLDAVLCGVTSQTAVQSHGYGYDSAGNRTKEIVGTAFTSETPDAQGLNQLTTRSSGTALPIRGTTNEPVSAVTVNGLAAKITGGNRFAGTANVSAGNNTVTVSATDYGQPPNTATKQYQVAVSAGANDSLSYDDSGNTLAGAGRTYEWDSLDRMTAVTVGAQRAEFLYDGLGRRRKITEKTSGTVTSVKRLAYDGVDVAEERVDATNVLTKQFFGTGMQVLTGADAGRYIYTRDHLGSIREAWKVESASVAVRYDYEPYGRRTKLVGGAFDADFGYTGHYTHAATGLVLSPTRPYEPSIARWLSRDQIEEEGGMNLYGYVENSPVNWIDPLGLYGDPFDPGFTPDPYVGTSAAQSAAGLGKEVKDAYDAQVGAAGLALTAASYCPTGRAAGAGKVVIGETMERVMPMAKNIGADWYKARGTNPANFLRNNMQWLRRQMKKGKEICDAGLDKLRKIRSPNYKAEKELLEKHNYPTTPIE